MIPGMIEIKKAIIKLSSDGKPRTVMEVHNELVRRFALTKEEVESMNPSRTDRTFYHRIRAAKQQLKREKQIEDIDGHFLLRHLQKGESS